MLRVFRWLFTVVVFGLSFVVNPAYVMGCGSSDDNVDTKMIEADLVRQLDELNGIHTWGFEQDGKQYELDLALTRATKADAEMQASTDVSFMSVAHACGTVTFYESASACFTVHQLAVKGSLSLRRVGTDAATIVSDVAVVGEVSIFGLTQLRFGDSYLNIDGDGSENYELRELMATNLGAEKLSFDVDTYHP